MGFYRKAKTLIKEVLLKLPFGDRIVKKILNFKKHIWLRSFKSTEDVFTCFYKHNLWSNPESRSGPGSTIEYTRSLRTQLPSLFNDFQVKTFLDAPCGDYNWFKEVTRSNSLYYIGADIVKEIVKRNNSLYSNSNTTFIPLNIIEERLPKADMWMCRDCLFHFSNKDIRRTLENFLDSSIPYLLTSVHTECILNVDTITGGWRHLNLEISPFHLEKPLLYIDDYILGEPVRKLGLWSRQMIARSLGYTFKQAI